MFLKILRMQIEEERERSKDDPESFDNKYNSVSICT